MIRSVPISVLGLCPALLTLAGCSTVRAVDPTIASTATQAIYPASTPTQRLLAGLTPPTQPVPVAVYGFVDQTGQFKPSDTGQTLSRAVTQGAGSILIKALQDAGGRRWFTIVEREQLRNLLTERQLIREMRERYLGEKGANAEALPALLFAGMLLEGGIIGYDSNTVTGGAGAAFLGIGAHAEYRQDTVTVYLRAVSVRTGEVLASVSASKTIASQALSASAFKFIAFKDLLEAEAGFTNNEPDQLALQQAIEKAVYGLIMEGAEMKLWAFREPQTGAALLQRYHQERDGQLSPRKVEAAVARSRRMAPLRVVHPASDDKTAPSAPSQ